MQNSQKRGILQSTMRTPPYTRFLRHTAVAALALTTVVGCTVASKTPAPPETLTDQLQIALNELQQTHQFPGATAAAILPDDSVITLATGFADIDTHRPMAPDTPQYIGDAGMSFLAALALHLDLTGQFDLDTPVHTVLDMQGQHAWFNQVPYNQLITLRHLLTHTSGIRDSLVAAPLNAETPHELTDPVTMPEDWVAHAAELKSDFRPGTGFVLSRMGYRLAGLVLEYATETPLKTLLHQEIEKSGDLTHTTIGLAEDIVAKGYPGEGDAPRALWAGNAVTSTPDDLVRWTKRLYEENLFTKPYLEDLLASGYRGSRGDSQYGLGVYIYETTAGEAYGHTGTFPGYDTNVIYFPRHQIGVCIQVNRSYGNDTRQYVQALAQVVLNNLPEQA